MTETNTPRTRTRQRPHTTTDNGEQRASGGTISKHDDTSHKPMATEQLTLLEGGPLLMARVTIADGVTLNMGDYNSFRRDVRLEVDMVLPGEPDPSGMLTDEQRNALDRLHDNVQDWVAEKIEAAMDDARMQFGD